MRIRPLSLAALGVVLAAIDLRLVAWDLLPDVLGWLLLAFGAHRLTMQTPALLFGVAAVASTAELQLRYHYEALDPFTGAVVPNPPPGTDYPERLAFLPLDGARLVLFIGSVALGGAALTMVLRELRRRAATTTDRAATERLAILSWVVPLAWIGPFVAIAVARAISDGELDPVWNGPWEVPALVGIAVALAVAGLFATTWNRRWSASGDEIGSPWAELMLRDADGPPS